MSPWKNRGPCTNLSYTAGVITLTSLCLHLSLETLLFIPLATFCCHLIAHTVPFSLTCFTSLKGVVSLITFADLVFMKSVLLKKKHAQNKSLIPRNHDPRLISSVHACVHSCHFWPLGASPFLEVIFGGLAPGDSSAPPRALNSFVQCSH